jgi:hypothetical protein
MSKIVDLLIGKQEILPPKLPPEVVPLMEWSDALWTSVLQRHVSPTGLVDYIGIQQDIIFLQLVEVVSRQSPTSHPELFPSETHVLSFWINAYNILTIWGVISEGITTSVQDSHVSSWIRINPSQDFFVANRIQIGGTWMNLYDLENKIIRVVGDARIHAAINCASHSCPILENKAFNAKDLDERLSLSMKRMIHSEKHLSIDTAKGVVYASLIFKWYKSDFDARNSKRLFNYWIRFAEEPLQSKLKQAHNNRYRIEWLPYDWRLNQTGIS